jgi:prepilin-type N-terminal cleavage/methylation domain-containing protein
LAGQFPAIMWEECLYFPPCHMSFNPTAIQGSFDYLPMARNDSKGFTLIELLVVIAIIGLLGRYCAGWRHGGP